MRDRDESRFYPSYREVQTVCEMDRLPAKAIEEYLTSYRFFITPGADDSLLLQEMGVRGGDCVTDVAGILRL